MSTSFLDDLQKSTEHWTEVIDALLDGGVSPAQLRGISAEQTECLYLDGLNLIKTGQFLQARQSLSTLCSLEWNQAKYWVALGVAHQNLRDYHKAILAYCRAALIEEDPRTSMRIAECWLRTGDIDECRKAFKSVIEWSDDDEAGRCLSEAAEGMLERLSSSTTEEESESSAD